MDLVFILSGVLDRRLYFYKGSKTHAILFRGAHSAERDSWLTTSVEKQSGQNRQNMISFVLWFSLQFGWFD